MVKHIDGETRIIFKSRISLFGFCSENIIWPKRIKRSWNKNLQRNDPLMLFFVQFVQMDYGRPTVKTESFNSRQLARKGVAVWCGAQFKMGFMVFSFTDQPNFMAAHVDLV